MIRVKRKYVARKRDIPNHAEAKVLILWEEDDAPVPDKERVGAAFRRITQLDAKHALATVDEGDVMTHYYRGGWVRIVSYDGGAVGMLIE